MGWSALNVVPEASDSPEEAWQSRYDRALRALRSPASDQSESALWEEIMLSAYYVGEPKLGLDACEELLGSRRHAPHFHEYVGRNATFYVPNVDAARRGRFELGAELLSRDGVSYAAMNPSVVRVGERLYVNVRLVNYRVENGVSWVSKSPDGIIRTRNVTLEWDPDGERLTRVQEASVVLPEAWTNDAAVRGLEDVRWVEHGGRVWFTANCHQLPGREGRPQVVLGRMSQALDAVEHLVELRYSGSGPVEKNWLPWSRNGTLYLVYGYDPFVVLHVDPTSGEANAAFCSAPARNASRFRGSAGPLRIPGTDRWLVLVHEVAHFTNRRVYTHRFVELNRHFEIVGWGRPFRFDHDGIEYGAGLCALDDDRLLVTYGWDEREARWAELRLETVLAGLRRHTRLTS